jgi:peptidoglycan hydrolase CwlO-like protein
MLELKKLIDMNKFNVGDSAYVIMRHIGPKYVVTEVTVVDVIEQAKLTSNDIYYKTQIKDTIMLTIRKSDEIYKTIEEAKLGATNEIKADIEEYKGYLLEEKNKISKLEEELKTSRLVIDNLQDKINTLKNLLS